MQRRKFAREFKLEAVRMIRERGVAVAQAARDLDVQANLLKLSETLLLFAALFCTLPYIPSNDIERLPIFPLGAVAVLLFVGGRTIRWQRAYGRVVFETLLFALFVWASNAAVNVIYGS